MTVKELRKALKQMPSHAQVHMEIANPQGLRVRAAYGDVQGVSQAEVNVVVISNRNRVLTGERA